MKGRPTRPVGPPRSRRRAVVWWLALALVLSLLSLYLYVMFATFKRPDGEDVAYEETGDEATGERLRRIIEEAMENDKTFSRKRKILLSTGHGKWNTGVWPSWGYGREVTLNWAAAGVLVTKQCSVECEFVHEGADGYGQDADAVVMELTNHPKFGYGRDVPIAWPTQLRDNPRRWYVPAIDDDPVPHKLPMTGLFYYEPAQMYPGYTLRDDSVQAHIDFSMTPDLDSTLPVTLICPWGRSVGAYVEPPPNKNPDRFIAYFNEHGIASPFSAIVEQLFEAAGGKLHRYGPHRSNMRMPPEAGGNPYALSRRIDFMSTYKFILITEAVVQPSYISPEWSHAILAGAVPVYIGAPDIAAFAPGPRSYVDIRDFQSGSELWEFLQRFDSEEAYQQWLEWKKGARKAFVEDEGGKDTPVGTGLGINLSVLEDLDQEWLQKELRRSSAPSSFHGLESMNTKNGNFQQTAMTAWRRFRSHIDHCVHYAECRMCEFVTKLS